MLNTRNKRPQKRVRSTRGLVEAALFLIERNYLLMTDIDNAVTDLTGAVNQLGADQDAAFKDLEQAITDLKGQIAAGGSTTPPDTTDVDNAVAALRGLTTKLQQFDASAVQADPNSAVNNPPAPAPDPTPAPVDTPPADAPVDPAPVG